MTIGQTAQIVKRLLTDDSVAYDVVIDDSYQCLDGDVEQSTIIVCAPDLSAAKRLLDALQECDVTIAFGSRVASGVAA